MPPSCDPHEQVWERDSFAFVFFHCDACVCDASGVPGERHEVYYDCCPEPYVDITFTIHIR